MGDKSRNINNIGKKGMGSMPDLNFYNSPGLSLINSNNIKVLNDINIIFKSMNHYMIKGVDFTHR